MAVRREVSVEIDSEKELGKVGTRLSTSDRCQKPKEETRLSRKIG